MKALDFARNLLGLLDSRARGQLAGLVVMMMFAAAIETVGIGMVVPFIGLLGNPDLVESNAWLRRAYRFSGLSTTNDFVVLLGAALLAIYVIKNAYLGLVTFVQARLVFGEQAALSRRLLAHYMRGPYALHLRRNSAELVNIVINENNGVFYGLLLPSLTLIIEGLVILFVVAFLIAVEPRVAFATIAVIGVTGYLLQALLKRAARSTGVRRADYARDLHRLANQALGSVKEAKMLGREKYFVDAYGQVSDRYSHATQLLVTLNALPRLAMETIMVGGMLTVAFMLRMRVDLAQTLPMLALFGMAAIRLLPSITRILQALNSLRFYYPSLNVIRRDIEFARSFETAEAASTKLARDGSRQRLPTWHDFEARDVSYRYAEDQPWSLRNVSLVIPRGEAMALVGPTGAGKSTLVDVILGLLQPSKGEVTVDGAAVQTMLAQWQQSIGYVPQTIYLLDDSVRRNIAFGVPDSLIDDARIWQVLHVARLDEKVKGTPRGLDEVIGERGVRFSGGERQRIGIARALYHDPEMLVFDEATSALDNQTEREIAETINGLIGIKTIVLIAHRLTTARLCRHIVYLVGGKVADSGTFDEILARNDSFRQMVGDI